MLNPSGVESANQSPRGSSGGTSLTLDLPFIVAVQRLRVHHVQLSLRQHDREDHPELLLPAHLRGQRYPPALSLLVTF